MKIILLNPFFSMDRDKDVDAVNPVLGLASVAAYIEQNGMDVKFLDVLAEGQHTVTLLPGNRKRYGLTEEQMIAYLLKEKPQVVGITCIYTAHAQDAHALAQVVKKADPGIRVVFGGAHASAYAEQVLADVNVDVVVKGEGEITFLELLKCWEAGTPFQDILGTVVRQQGRVKVNAPRPLVENLDDFPFPARHLIPFEQYMALYRKRTNFLMRPRAATMVTSRGCPMNCVYCAVKTIFGRTWRGRSPKNVVDEIQLLIEKYGVQEIHFLDDSMAVNRKRLEGICDEILARKLDVCWTTPNGIAIWQLDEALIRKMKAAGCYRLTFGLESGNPETLKFIGKNYKLDRARELIAFCHKIGLWTLGTFIIGFPEEKRESMQDTLRYALESKLDFAVFYTATPFPGTRMYEIFQEKGLLINPEVSLFTGGVNTEYFTKEELNVLRDQAFRTFMLNRLLHGWRFLTHLRAWEDLVYFWKLVRNLVLPLIFHAGALNPEVFWKRKQKKQ